MINIRPISDLKDKFEEIEDLVTKSMKQFFLLKMDMVQWSL